MRTIRRIIIHCTGTQEDRPVTVGEINRWHKHRGWAEIGYHYVIYLGGTIHKGRHLEQIGAHCKGYNSDSIGICYVGGLTKDGRHAKDTRTPEQKASLVKLLTILKEEFPNATIHGHNEFSNKACPCFNVREEYGPGGEKLKSLYGVSERLKERLI